MKSNIIPYAEVQLLLDWTEFSKHLSSLKLLYQTMLWWQEDKTRTQKAKVQVCSETFDVFYLLDSSLICIPILPDFTDFKRETHFKNTCENAWYIFKYYTNIKAHLWLLLYVICHLRWSDVDIKCTLFSKLAVLQVLFYCSLPLFYLIPVWNLLNYLPIYQGGPNLESRD